MASPLSSGSDRPAVPAAAGALRAQPDDRSFETDISALAARFASRSGGGLSPELASDLALEIVLHEIAEQACIATGATGAAIVLHREGELICRARSGKTVPELGSRLAAESGLSAECIRTGLTQRCDDIEADPRADVDASRKLGVLSVLAMPLLRGDELAGVFELFSSRTYAFGDREERALEGLAQRTLKSLQFGAEPRKLPVEEVPVTESVDKAADESRDSEAAHASRLRGDVTWIWTVAVVASAALLAVAVIVPSQWRKAAPRGASAPSSEVGASAGGDLAGGPYGANPTASTVSAEKPVAAQSRNVARHEAGDIDSIPAGSLSVYSDGKEVFHELPPQNEQRTSGGGATETIIELSPATNAAIVLKRVAPEYPPDARRQRIQGPVVLDVQISAGGDVQNVWVVSGPPALTSAGMDAMKQWKFKPRTVDGVAQEMRTLVTLRFRLPK